MAYSLLGQKLTLSSMAVSSLNASLGFTILKKLSWISHISRFFKVARYSFSGSIPAKFEHKLRSHKQSFGKIATTVV